MVGTPEGRAEREATLAPAGDVGAANPAGDDETAALAGAAGDMAGAAGDIGVGITDVGGGDDRAMLVLPMVKGHGTENDFVLIPDVEGERQLSIAQVRYLANRRAGLGGDGVIRIAPTLSSTDPLVRGQAGQARWFMDYRNADGSIAQMCGNGVRVFASYLRHHGLETGDEFVVATRGGPKAVRFDDGLITVGMGRWDLLDPEHSHARGFDMLVGVAGLDPLPALTLDLGNPHAVVALPEGVDLDGLDLTQPLQLNPDPPEGINVELVHTLADGHLRMRVVERGVGETRSCGTGACAAALAIMMWSGNASTPLHDSQRWVVDVPGGRLIVRALPDHTVELTGPAVLVAEGTVCLPLV